MSKRLPYYQSEPAEYLAGDIMFCSYAAQGVFSIIRALYWQKDCNLTLNQIKRRCKGADDLINELINEDIIKVNGEAISIYFLDEQFDKATNRAKTNSENGKKGAEARWKNSKDNSESIATPLKSDGESIALREDKIKEDKIKENNIVLRGTEFKNSLKQFLDVFGKDTLNDFYMYWTETKPNGKKMRYEMEKTFNIERRLQRWSKNNFNNKNNQKAENNEQLKNITTSIRSSNPEL